MNGPRNVAGPVVRGTDFWGRDAEVGHLWRLLNQGSVLLTGPRRHGKSSLMYGLHDNPEEKFRVILLDVEWIQTPEEFLTTMAAELLALNPVREVVKGIRAVPSALSRWIGGVIDEVGVGLGNIGELKIRLRQNLKDGEVWPELAEQMLGTLRSLPERVVLILDEFPMMIGNMLDQDSAAALRFLRWFRTFRQSPGTERLTFILGGSTNVEPRLESLSTEAVLGDLQRFRLMPFAPNKALTFVRELFQQEGTTYESGVPERIIEISGSGVPYYLQTIVAECLAEARRCGRPITQSAVGVIYEEHVIGPINRHRFSHYHTRLRLHYGPHEETARIVLASLCNGPKRVDDLRDCVAAGVHDPLSLERVLVLLEGDYYILRDGHSVEFSDGLLRDWWRRNSVPPRVRP
jgi:hypothetical protein